MRTEKKDKVVTNSHGQISLFADNNGLTINSFFIEPVIPETTKVVEKYLKDLSVLKRGDRIRVEFDFGSNAVVEGYFATKGFWDGRDQGDFNYYYMEVINEKGNARRRFREFSPRCKVTVLESYETTGYFLPDKFSVIEELKKRLEGKPADKMIAIYQNFEKEYPYLSYEWRGITSNAWKVVLPTVVSEEDALELFKKNNKNCGKKIPTQLKSGLKEIFENYIGQERVEQLYQLRWLEARRESFDKEIKAEYCRFNLKDVTYYKPLVETILKNTKNEKLFFEAVNYKGYMCKYVVEGDKIHFENETVVKNYTIWKSEEWQKTGFVPYMMRNKQQNSKVS